MQVLEFDREQAIRHLSTIWSGYEGENWFEIRIIPLDRRQGWPIVKFFKDVEGAVEWIDENWNKLRLYEKHVFYGVLPRCRLPKKGGRSEDVKWARTFFCDLDYHKEMRLIEALIDGKVTEEDLKREREDFIVQENKVVFIDKPALEKVLRHVETKMGMKPQLVIDSGHGYHLYFILKETIDVEEWYLTQSSLINKLGGDEKTKDPARLLRVAGTWNLKYRSKPVSCRIAYIEEGEVSIDIVKEGLSKLS